MKRCPECRRDYDDPTLSFCLDDGTALLEGPASTGEPATAILPGAPSTSESPTRTLNPAEAEATRLFTDQVEKSAKTTGSPKATVIAAIIGALVVTALGVGGYWFYGRDSSRQIESIAVMPFVNESGNEEIEYLSDGITETLISSLSKIPNLSVKSRNIVFFYKGKETSPRGIGEELGVQAVLLGRIVQRGDDLRLNLELVNTQTQDVIWSEQYDRRRSDLVSLQSELARDVSTKLKIKLSDADEARVTNTSTENPEAYQAYLKGRYYWNRRTAEDIKKAIADFKIATDQDPNYALAYAGLADCYVILNEYAGTPLSETVPLAKTYAERASEIDDQLAEPHASLGMLNEFSWQWANAEREFKRAIELNLNYATAYHWYSIFLRGQKRFDDAALMIKRAKELDPLSSVISVNLSEIYQIQNDQKASIENSLKIIELDPDFSYAYGALGLSYLKEGRNADAVINTEKAVELSNRAGVRLRDLGYVYGVTGNRANATTIAKELEEKYARKESLASYVAAVYAGLGEKDKAFEWLEKDFRNKGYLGDVRWRIPFEPLRDDPRFKDLLRRLNLPE